MTNITLHKKIQNFMKLLQKKNAVPIYSLQNPLHLLTSKQ